MPALGNSFPVVHLDYLPMVALTYAPPKSLE